MKIILAVIVAGMVSHCSPGHGKAAETLNGLVVRTIDGDTLEVMVKVRVRGIDTPEIAGKCPIEIAAALDARDATEALVGRVITLRKLGVDRYGRLLATIETEDGQDLASALIRLGQARPWKGRREQWCD
jgi:endonuclease YncB( thermonuclease family)